jgi:hypothetical protein
MCKAESEALTEYQRPRLFLRPDQPAPFSPRARHRQDPFP